MKKLPLMVCFFIFSNVIIDFNLYSSIINVTYPGVCHYALTFQCSAKYIIYKKRKIIIAILLCLCNTYKFYYMLG